MDKIGIGILTWKRRGYVQRLVKSLEANQALGFELRVYQDGSVCKHTGKRLASYEDLDRVKDIYTSSGLMMDEEDFYRSPDNVGIAVSKGHLLNDMANRYEAFIFLEEDVTLSKNFLPLARRLVGVMKENKRIACVSPGFKLLCRPEDVDGYKMTIAEKQGHLWAEIFLSARWKKLQPAYEEYLDIIKGIPYGKQIHHKNAEIKELFMKLGQDSNVPTSSDSAIDAAIIGSGMHRYRMIVNRATGIGDNGFHATPEKMAAHGDTNNHVHSFDDELELPFEVL